MTGPPLRLGFSPCPNDTFMFHALVHGRVVVPGTTIAPVLLDIEELNRRAAGPDPLPVTKLSVGALAAVADRYAVLPAGAALGRGVGPLLVARPVARAPRRVLDLAGRRVAIPGVGTTAFLLLRLFGPEGIEPVEMPFDRIVDSVATGRVDAGLIIHESRFTFAESGLVEVADLGKLWELETGLPLPLGVIGASRGLPDRFVDVIGRAVRASIEYARADPQASRDYVRAHAQELSDAVCSRHIALYVNEFSVDLGGEGIAAIDELLRRGRAGGLLPGHSSAWR